MNACETKWAAATPKTRNGELARNRKDGLSLEVGHRFFGLWGFRWVLCWVGTLFVFFFACKEKKKNTKKLGRIVFRALKKISIKIKKIIFLFVFDGASKERRVGVFFFCFCCFVHRFSSIFWNQIFIPLPHPNHTKTTTQQKKKHHPKPQKYPKIIQTGHQ